jgi:hypothetical protein
MLVSSEQRWPTLSVLMLVLLIGACATQAFESTVPLVVERVVVIDSLEKIEARGVTIHIEPNSLDSSMAIVRVCKERIDLPGEVSASLLVSLRELDESGRENLLMSFSKQMRLSEESHVHDSGRFQVATERLGALSLLVMYSYRDSGESWVSDDSAIRFSFKDIVHELRSEERTFFSTFDSFDCDLPSGIYVYSPQ